VTLAIQNPASRKRNLQRFSAGEANRGPPELPVVGYDTREEPNYTSGGFGEWMKLRFPWTILQTPSGVGAGGSATQFNKENGRYQSNGNGRESNKTNLDLLTTNE
jgi:hypothetical protein